MSFVSKMMFLGLALLWNFLSLLQGVLSQPICCQQCYQSQGQSYGYPSWNNPITYTYTYTIYPSDNYDNSAPQDEQPTTTGQQPTPIYENTDSEQNSEATSTDDATDTEPTPVDENTDSEQKSDSQTDNATDTELNSETKSTDTEENSEPKSTDTEENSEPESNDAEQNSEAESTDTEKNTSSQSITTVGTQFVGPICIEFPLDRCVQTVFNIKFNSDDSSNDDSSTDSEQDDGKPDDSNNKKPDDKGTDSKDSEKKSGQKVIVVEANSESNADVTSKNS